MPDSTETFEINGHTLTVDTDARDSWELFDLMCEVGTEFDPSKMGIAFRIVEACTGVDKAEFVAMCGGKGVHRDVVLENLSAALAAILPKN